MTIGTQPELLVLGYLRNQTIFDQLDHIKSISVDWDREVAEVDSINGYKPAPQGGLEGKNLIEQTLSKIEKRPLSREPLLQSDIYKIILQVKNLNTTYQEAGSVHGCGLCQNGEVLVFFEDVGRHSATDAISGKMWLDDIQGDDKVFYTTGRLTSEIVVKSALMGIPTLISRNGTTHMAFELAQQLGITLISRAKSQHFVALNGQTLIFDADVPRKTKQK